MSHGPDRGRFLLLFAVSAGMGLFLTLGGCRSKGNDRFVALFCLDGGTQEVIDDLRSQGKAPAFERLIRSGTYGLLESQASRKITIEEPRWGYFSPIVWTTIATGKIPEKHGIRDFVLPVPGTSTVWMGTHDDSARSEVGLPEVGGESPFTLYLRLRSYRPNGEQPVQLFLNDELLESIQVPVRWKDFSLRLPTDGLRPAKNRLALVFSRQTSPAEDGESADRRRLACELASLRITDSQGQKIFSLDPVYQRFSLLRGFYLPRAELTEVQSVHWRAMPLWSLLGSLGHPVGVIGYWGTWPAYEVNGFLVASRMGIRGQRKGSSRLTWPPELAAEIEPLAPDASELGEMFAELHVSDCEPPFVDRNSVLKKILVQDEYYFRISRKLLPPMERGFFAAYFRSIDVGSHVALHLRHGAEIGEGCPDSVRGIVDQIYVQIDRWLGHLLELLPEHATVFVVSDHGMAPGAHTGNHAPFGIFLASGPGIRRDATVHGASALDVTPTLLHSMGAPISQDMDGKVLAQIFETRWLSENAPRYVDMDTSIVSDENPLTEGTEEILEQLRALGYIQ